MTEVIWSKLPPHSFSRDYFNKTVKHPYNKTSRQWKIPVISFYVGDKPTRVGPKLAIHGNDLRKLAENGVMVWLWRRILFNGFSERARIWNSLRVDKTHPDFSIHTYLTKVTFTWRLVDMVLLTIWLLLTLILIAQSNVLSNKCERRIKKKYFVLLTILAKDIRSWA